MLDLILEIAQNLPPLLSGTAFLCDVSYVRERNSDIFQRKNGCQLFQLLRKIKSVTGARIDAGRPQKADCVIEAKSFRRNSTQACKFPDSILHAHFRISSFLVT